MADDNNIICPPPAPVVYTALPAVEPTVTVEADPPTSDLIGKERTVVEQDDYQATPWFLGPYEQGITPYVNFSDPHRVGQSWTDRSEIADRFRWYGRSYWTERSEFETLEEGDSNIEYTIEGIATQAQERFFQYATYGGTTRSGNRPRARDSQGLAWNAFAAAQSQLPQHGAGVFTVTGIDDPRPLGLSGDFLYRESSIQKITISARHQFFREPLVDAAPNEPSFKALYWEEFVRGTVALLGHGVTLHHGVILEPLVRGFTRYSDFSFKITVPILPDELFAFEAAPAGLSTARWDSEYNFFIKEYESALEQFLVTPRGPFESLLPNMYLFIAEKLMTRDDISDWIDFLTLDGNARNTDVIEVLRNGMRSERSESAYFTEWARAFKSLAAQQPDDEFLEALARVLEKVEKYNKVVYAGPGDFKLLRGDNNKKSLFPMYVDLEFSTDGNSSAGAADLLDRHELVTSLIKETFRTDIPDMVGTEDFVYSTNFQKEGDSFTEIKLNQPTKVFDFSLWINTYLSEEQVGHLLNGPDETTPFMYLFAPRAEAPFVRSGVTRIAAVMEFAHALADYSEDKFRTFPEIMRGELAQSETLFYKIAKHTRLPNGELYPTPVQEIFLPNSSDTDILSYIDTQIANEKSYKYIVYAYELVWGSDYMYKFPRPPGNRCSADAPCPPDETCESIWNDHAWSRQCVPAARAINEEGEWEEWAADAAQVINPGATFDVATYPHLKIFEIPFFEFDTLVADKPPLPPDVEFIPFRGVNNRILFLFRSMTGEIKAHPIFMSDGDEEEFDIIRQAQGLGEGEMLDWKGDDPAYGYEIFRTTMPPKSYRDFFGEPYQKVLAEEPLGCGDVSSTEFFEDELEPNVKYYYTFREIDVHAKFSNPTEVFEVELVDDNGLIFPRIKVYDFPELKLEKEMDTFTRYLLITPAVGQDELYLTNENPETVTSAVDAEVQLGVVEEAVFPIPALDNDTPDDSNQAKFKIRITSKQTGKKIDVNVKFRHVHNKELKCS